MCQATVYLDDVVVMQDVMIVEPVPDGVRLIALFEPVKILPAVIQKVDLIKHRVMLKSFPERGAKDE